MLLLLICLFLNYDLFNCEQARKRSGRSNKSQLSAQIGDKSENESDSFIRELREKMGRAQVEGPDQDFGVGLEDYNISPMEVFTPPTGENNNFLGKAKGRSLAEDHNEDFMNYDVTNMFWSGTPKIGDTLEYTTPISFLPTPEGFGITSQPTLDPWQILDNFTGETATVPGPPSPFNSEYPDPLVDGPASTIHKFGTPNVILVPHYMLGSTVFPRPSFPFSVPPVSTPTPLMVPVPPTIHNTGGGPSPSMYTGPLLHWSKPLTSPIITTTIRTVPTTTTTTTESTTTSTTSSTLSPRPPIPIEREQVISAGPGVMSEPKVKAEITEKTESLIDELATTKSTAEAVAEKPLEKDPTLSNIKSKIHDKQWTLLIGGPTTKPTPVSKKYKPTTKPTTTTLSTEEPTQPFEASTSIISYIGLLTPETDGFMYVSTPEAIPELYDQNTEILTPTTAGNVLLQPYTLTTSTMASPASKYLQMMEDLNEGFLGIFLLEFTRLLSEKNMSHVRAVMINVEILMNQFEATGSLNFLGEKLAEKAQVLSMAFTEAGQNPGTFRNLSILAHLMIKQRRTAISDDVNYLIDTACLFFNDAEGEHLFNTLMEFENYPNVTTSAVDLCKNLLDALSRPFRRLSKTNRAAQLRNLAEAAVQARFGRRTPFQELIKLTEPETTILNPSSNYNQIYSLKQRMEMKRRRKNLTRRVFDTAGVLLAQLTNQPMEQPRLRSMLPITRNQKRFRVITKRQRAVTNFANIERPTRNDHFRKSGRVIHPYNEMMQFFPQIPKEYLRHVL